jgi:type I restriction enzyme, S subunit
MIDMGRQKGSLPHGWVEAFLGDIAIAINPGFPSGKHNKQGLGIPHLRPMNISSKGEIDLSDVKYVEVGNYDPLKEGDILFNNTNSPVLVGKTACIPKDTAWAYSNHMTKIRLPKEDVDSKCIALFLHHLFEEGFFQRHCNNHVNQASIGTSFLVERVKIPFPPLPEQHRIVSKIEELFTKLDAGTEDLKRAKAQLRRYRQAVLQTAVTGQLTYQWREKNIDKSKSADELLSNILDAHRNRWEQRELAKMRDGGKQSKGNEWKQKYRPPKEPDIDSLPELPHGWVWATAEQLASAEDRAMTDGPFGSNLKTEHYTNTGPRVIRLQNIGSCEFIDEKAHISNDRFLKLKKHAVYSGDIVVRSLGLPSPTACMIPDWVGDAIVKADCFRYKVAEPFVNPKYVMHALNSPSTQKRTETLVHGVGRPRLNLNEVKSIPLPLPPFQEQTTIADEVESRFSIMDEVSSIIDANLKRIKALRRSILRRAFQGKLIPQDPNDEPAEKLLEKISQSASKSIQSKRKRKSNGDTPNGK